MPLLGKSPSTSFQSHIALEFYTNKLFLKHLCADYKVPAYTIEGSILDVNGNSLSNVSISIHEHLPLDFLDHLLDSTLSGNDGSFRISFKTWIKPRIYLTINDSKKQFKSVVYNGESFDKMGGPSESVVWRSSLLDLDNLKNIKITVNIIPSRKIPDKYDAVVIGSGFGGTISSLTLAKGVSA